MEKGVWENGNVGMGNGNGTYCLESLVQIVEEVHGEWLESLALKGGGDIGEEEGLSQETITERRPLGRQLTRWWAGLLGYFISSFYPFPVYSSVVNFVPHYKDTMELTFRSLLLSPLYYALFLASLKSPFNDMYFVFVSPADDMHVHVTVVPILFFHYKHLYIHMQNAAVSKPLFFLFFLLHPHPPPCIPPLLSITTAIKGLTHRI